MGYDKPKVTIDLEEYNDLIKSKNSQFNPEQVATIAFNIGFKAMQELGINYNINNLINKICKDLDYTLDIKIMAEGTMDPYGLVKIIKK